MPHLPFILYVGEGEAIGILDQASKIGDYNEDVSDGYE